MKAPSVVTVDCSRCGGAIAIPIRISGPVATSDNEATCEVFADCSDVKHKCLATLRPRNRSEKARP